jgi:glycosyltransferase involved in cell wall biosynthesis
LFSGDFFRKGGANLIDVFEQLQKEFEGIRLRVCCDEKVDFITSNDALKAEYLDRIRSNSAITFGRVPREQMLREVLPETDIYLLPTYYEAFGFAILEAMAYGIPVVASNVFAIPELLTDGHSGLLIDLAGFDCARLFPGYRVNAIPESFRQSVNEQLLAKTRRLIGSPVERRRIGQNALNDSRSRFGFAARNKIISKLYRNAI